MTAIHLENINISYGAHAVIDNVALTIKPGSFFTLLGPSGCGKTTLLRAIAGFVPLKSGRIRFGETDVTNLPAHLRNIGMVFQDYALFPDKNVFENVAYGLRARKQAEADIRAKVAEALYRVGLSELSTRLPAALSGGQRQRVALARALVIAPQVLLMDEPLSNLDAKLRIQVRETIALLQKESGITTILVTHDQEEALALSDEICVLRDGTVEQVGTPSEIYQRSTSTYVADFVGGANAWPVHAPQDVAAHQNTTIKWSGRSLRVNTVHAVSAGQAFLVARPESIALSKSGDGFDATITQRQYLGSKIRYTIAFPFGLTAHVERPATDAAFSPGEGVKAQFDAASTLLVKT